MRQTVETTKMSTKGQVIIPKETREFTDSKPETIFTVFPLSREIIVLKKLDKEKVVAEFRAVRAKVKNKLSEAEVNEIIHKSR
ncbi:MAG: AbrB/MazE/SpoVT family DNA-binding domain-containing protein [Candidatus Diapherotrites archaeon]|nr:AbrB/MazE/SpoVT family DNA-binding domain-containing protein [Candidatus Diapherotrites archaeon]